MASLAVLALSAGLACTGAAAPAVAAPASSMVVAAFAPVIDTGPYSDVVTAGDTVSWTSSADSGTPQWQISDDNGATWNDIAGATDPAYSFVAHYDGIDHQYRVGYTNGDGPTYTDPAIVTVNAGAPTMLTQPTPDTTVDSGTSVTLSASATGDPEPTSQQWQRSDDNGDWVDLPGATGPSYTFTATTADMGHAYRAEFTSAGGVVDSDYAYVEVNETAPTVSTQPTDQSVAAGTDATFTAAATGDNAPTVQWQEQYHGAGYWQDIDGATSDSYTVPAPTLDDSTNRYRAVYSNDVATVETNAAKLTVTGTAPSAPMGLSATQTGPGEVTLTWNTPTSPGDSAIGSYDAGYSAGQWGNGTSVDATQHRAVFTGLTTQTYSFSVAAVNLAGPGARVAQSLLVIGAAPTENASASTLTAGQVLTLSGLATPGAHLTVDRALPGQPYRGLTSLTVPANGHWTKALTVTSNANYRAHLSTGQTSAGRWVAVRDRMSIAATRTARRTYTVSGTVYPGVTNQVVRVYQRGANASYALLGTVRTSATGHWSLRHKFPRRARYTVVAVSSATAMNAWQQVATTIAAR